MRLIKRSCLKLLLSSVIISASLFSPNSGVFAASELEAGNKWITTWAASPYSFTSWDNSPHPAPLNKQTVRQNVRISVGGGHVRVRFSNEIGTTPLTIGAASIALVDKESTIVPKSLRALTFSGKSEITLPPGAPALSDPVKLTVDDLSELAISIYLPNETELSTMHMQRTAFVSSPGDFTQAVELTDAEKMPNSVFLTGVYVSANEDTGVIAAVGDSITDGAGSTLHTYRNWPQQLAERLTQQDGNHRKMAVVNHGLSGNQLLSNGVGVGLLGRFDRDVLSIAGLTHIILLIGINDIGAGGMKHPGSDALPMRSAEEIIAGYQQFITRARLVSPHIKVYGATLTPFAGTIFPGYYSEEKENIRLEINQLIRAGNIFDAVIDFDKAIRDSVNLGEIAAKYNSGDKLHPGDIGYKKMAESIDLTLFQ